MHDLADVRAAGGLGESHRSDDVHRRVERWVLDRVAHGDLGGEVEDHLRPNVGEQTDEVGVDDVGLDELEVGLLLGFVEVGAAARAEVIDASDGVTVCQKAINQRGSDEPGCPRHQCAHRLTIPTAAVRIRPR